MDLVGWSQGGGPLPVYYATKLGGAEKIHKAVGIVPSHHGTNFWLAYDHALRFPPAREQYDVVAAAINGMALAQQLAGSKFMTDLYSQPVPVDYMNISTVNDGIVMPHTNSFLPGADNRLVQDYCPGHVTMHVTAPYDPVVHALVIEGLTGQVRPKNCQAVPSLS